MTKSITEAVAKQLSEISPVVNEKVINALVEREVEKRSKLIIDGLEKLRSLQNELKKIKPDVGQSFDENGVETKPTQYSKAKYEERKKLLEQISKLQAALDLAVEQGDISKLNELK